MKPSEVLTNALANMDGGKRWTKREWSTVNKYVPTDDAHEPLHVVEFPPEACMCLEGAIMCAVGVKSVNHRNNDTNYRKATSYIQRAYTARGGDLWTWNPYGINDRAKDFSDIEAVFVDAIALAQKDEAAA